MDRLLTDYWPVVAAVIAVIFWLGRLEGKVSALEASDSQTVLRLNAVCESLARIEGHLGIGPKTIA